MTWLTPHLEMVESAILNLRFVSDLSRQQGIIGITDFGATK